MRCTICRQGRTALGFVTVTLERGMSLIVIKEVTVDVCENCGEYYLSEPITEKIYAMAESAVKQSVVVEILRYAA